MNFVELKDRYRSMSVLLRVMVILTILGGGAAYFLYDDFIALQKRREVGEDRRTAIRTRLEREKVRRSKIPELEAKLIFIRQQLAESRKRLPDEFRIDRILELVASVGKETGVDLRLFDPQAPIPGAGSFRFVSMAIRVEVIGKYSEIAHFFDEVASLQAMVHIRDFSVEPLLKGDSNPSGPAIGGPKSADSQRRAIRRKFRLIGRAKIVAYRSMTEEESRLYEAAERSSDKTANDVDRLESQPLNAPQARIPKNGKAI